MKKTRYFSYLLRLWETSDDGEPVWRASLESPGSGQRRGFANLQDLFNFLHEQMTQANPDAPAPPCLGQKKREKDQ
jgi:hypothetical protein